MGAIEPKPNCWHGPIRRKENTFKSQSELKRKQANFLKRGKTRATKLCFVLASVHLIDWKDSANFMDLSQSEVQQNQRNAKLLFKLNWKFH